MSYRRQQSEYVCFDLLLQIKEARNNLCSQAGASIRNIFIKLERLNEAAAIIARDWMSCRSKPSPNRGPDTTQFDKRWAQSYLEIEKVILSLLAYEKINVIETFDRDGYRSFHLDVLHTVANINHSFCKLFMTEFPVYTVKDRRAFGLLPTSQGVSIHDLLDNVRRFRNWCCYARLEGVASPKENGTPIAIPSGRSLSLWYYMITRVLVGCFKYCWERDMNIEELTRKYTIKGLVLLPIANLLTESIVTGKTTCRFPSLPGRLADEMDTEDDHGEAAYNPESTAISSDLTWKSRIATLLGLAPQPDVTRPLSDLQGALHKYLASLEETTNQRIKTLKRLHAQALQRAIIDDKIVQIELQRYAISIHQERNTLQEREKWARLTLINKATWDALGKEALEINTELKRLSKETTTFEGSPLLAMKFQIDAGLSTTQTSIHRSANMDERVYNSITSQYRSIIRDLEIEKIQLQDQSSALRIYNKHLVVQCTHLRRVAAIAGSQVQDHAQRDSAYQRTQQENRSLTAQLEWKDGIAQWMESARKTATREREEMAQERDSLKTELETLKADQSRDLAEAKEQGRQEIREIVAQSLQHTLAIVSPVQRNATPIGAVNSTVSSGDNGSTKTGDRRSTGQESIERLNSRNEA